MKKIRYRIKHCDHPIWPGIRGYFYAERREPWPFKSWIFVWGSIHRTPDEVETFVRGAIVKYIEVEE